MSRATVLGLAAALLAATAFAAPPLRAEEPAPAASTKPPVISVVEAATREVVATVIVTGSLVPREEIQVGVDVDGLKVSDLLADAGDTVATGALLARLSTDTIDVQLAQNASQLARADAAIAQARSQIGEAEAASVQADQQLERTRALAAKGVVAQDVLDQRVSAADAARARLSAARHFLTVAEADRTLVQAQGREIALRKEKAEIKAPLGGLVLERTARIGAVVSSQSGALFRIARDGEIELAAEIPEDQLARTAPGQTVVVTPAGGTPVNGTVRLVWPEIDPATRLGKVRIALPAGAAMRPGAFARGEVVVARSTGVTVPVAALVSSGDTQMVQVVKDGRIESRVVETGLSSEGVVEIVKGLAPGETVVARAGTFVRDGDAVTPVVAGDQGAKG